MNISTRAAQQLHNLDPDHVAAILDHLRDADIDSRQNVVEIDIPGHRFRAFVARRLEDDALMLLGVVEPRPP